MSSVSDGEGYCFDIHYYAGMWNTILLDWHVILEKIRSIQRSSVFPLEFGKNIPVQRRSPFWLGDLIFHPLTLWRYLSNTCLSCFLAKLGAIISSDRLYISFPKNLPMPNHIPSILKYWIQSVGPKCKTFDLHTEPSVFEMTDRQYQFEGFFSGGRKGSWSRSKVPERRLSLSCQFSYFRFQEEMTSPRAYHGIHNVALQPPFLFQSPTKLLLWQKIPVLSWQSSCTNSIILPYLIPNLHALFLNFSLIRTYWRFTLPTTYGFSSLSICQITQIRWDRA